MVIRDSWAVHRERMRLTMFSFTNTARQAFNGLALVVVAWLKIARRDFDTCRIATP